MAIKFRIPTRRNPQVGPREAVLEIEDGVNPLKGKTLDELIHQLRQKYPDGKFQRELRRERDFEAEHAMEKLARLLACAVVERFLREVGERTESNL
jgi:hypothetical protein